MKTHDRQSVDEQVRLVPRYVAGDLSRSERAEFEAWLIASPELAAEVEMERRLRRGIASAARRGWLKSGAAPQATGMDRRWGFAVAASLVIALTGLGISALMPRQPADAPEASTATHRETSQRVASRTVRLSSLRGVSQTPDIAIARIDAPAQLVVEPDVVTLTCEDGTIVMECPGGAAAYTPQYPEYEMDLVSRRSLALAWRSGRQQPVAGTQLSFTLSEPGALPAGEYDLLVRGHAADHDEVVARFWLRVTQ